MDSVMRSGASRGGPAAVVGAAVLWGTAGTAGMLLLGTGPAVDPVALAAARLVIGGLVLALLARGAPPRPALLLPGAVAVAAYQLCFFAAVERAGVAVGTVVAIGSGPVFTGLFTWPLDRRRPSGRWAAATAAAIAGCALLVGDGAAQPGTRLVSGVLLALLGGALYAGYAVLAARAIAAGGAPAAVMGTLFGGAAVLMLPVLLLRDTAWLATPGGLLTALYLGCVTTALAYYLYGRGLRGTPVATAATLALAEPAVAALLGLALLGERLSAVSWAGLVLLAVALTVVARPGRSAAGADPAGGAAAARRAESSP